MIAHASAVRTIEQAWGEALYGPDGFYRRSAPADHFATSVQGVPGVDSLLAQAISAYADRLACTSILDLGAGRGELLRQLAGLRPDLVLTGCDVVARPGGLPERIAWLESPGGAALPDPLRDLEQTLVVAHEWLDVVPCPVLTRTPKALRQLTIDDSDGPLAEAADRAWAERWWPDGEVVEVGRPRDAAYGELVSRVSSGAVLAIDYGHLAGDRPWGGTLAGYRAGVVCPPQFDGSTDITAHVAMDSLGATRLATQGEMFAELLSPPAAPAYGLARTDPAGYLAALAARSAWSAATDPWGLGGFWWATTVVTS
ncbi:hypothetical protein G9U51_06115 [Calidifontibacter sp. DB0510]|uniref:SAM-dependent methyltransferase n=2 Tax=Metallococcus carri TaxID=1656884 RepID=A0A967AZR1_9MICO|nr:hypothetical protein [Metallococcus carri]NOP36436.1 hypothetical protein [Calidifontibacter sp. DB2511S]